VSHFGTSATLVLPTLPKILRISFSAIIEALVFFQAFDMSVWENSAGGWNKLLLRIDSIVACDIF